MRVYKGNVALIAVISMIAISLAGGFALTVSSVNYKLSTMGFIASTNMQTQIQSCKEEAFRKISRDLNFTGNISLTFDGGSCTSTISINTDNSNHRDVNITSTYSDFNKSKYVKVDVSVSPIREI